MKYLRTMLCTALLAALPAGCVGPDEESVDEVASAIETGNGEPGVDADPEGEAAEDVSAGDVPVSSAGGEDAIGGAVAAVARCTSKTITRYPGITSIGHLRYGQADVHVSVCSDDSPSNWLTSISVWNNTTGSLQGYDFINEEVHPVSDGSNTTGRWRNYQATFKWRSCTPYVGWPCTVKGTFSMNIQAKVPRTGNPTVVLQGFTAPNYWTLYTTP